MRRILIAVGFALLAPSAQAEQLADDVATLDACLAAATPWKESEPCIGVINEPCQQSGSYSTQEMVDCLARERRAWEVVLGEALTQLHRKASEIDARSEPRPDRPTVDASLTESQDAWIEYRTARCFYESHPDTGGSILRLYGAACFMRMTAERAIHLDRAIRHGD